VIQRSILPQVLQHTFILHLQLPSLKVLHQKYSNITLASYKIVFPAHLGFSYASTTPTVCYEMPTSLQTSNYINRAPACVFSTDSTGGIVLTVSNLRTSGTPTPTYYGLYFTGLTTGASARSSIENGSDGTTATTYVSTTAKETINANNFVFSYVEKTSDVSIVGNPA